MISFIPSCYLSQSNHIFLCQSRVLNTLLAHKDCVTTQWDLGQISKTSLTFNQSFYYLLKMCCNWTLSQKHKHPKKETFPTKPQQCIKHLTPSWEWDHQPFNAEIPATSCYTQNSNIPLKEILQFSDKSIK